MGDLLGSNALEIAIGVIFIFFLLSVLCSSINEFLAGLFKWRARDLVQALINMLGDGDKVGDLLNHPLINVLDGNMEVGPVRRLARSKEYKVPQLTDSPAKQRAVQFSKERTLALAAAPDGLTRATGGATEQSEPAKTVQINLEGVPSYIPSRTFAQALLDTVVAQPGVAPTATNVREAAAALYNSPEPGKSDLGRTLLALISDSQTPANVLQKLGDFQAWVQAQAAQNRLQSNQADTILGQLGLNSTLDDARGLARSLPQPLQGEALALLSDLETDTNKLWGNIETWFNNTMDAVSGAYKRRIKWYLFIIGCLVVAVTGADTVRMVRVLSTNSALRAVVVARAGEVVQQGGVLGTPTPTPAASATATLTATPTATPASASGGGAGGTTPAAPTPSPSATAVPYISTVAAELTSFSDLFGYDDVADYNSKKDGDWTFWPLKFIGLLMTAFALSLGAPFWFDVLSKAVDLRAGRKPQDGTGGSPGTASGNAGGSGGGGK